MTISNKAPKIQFPNANYPIKIIGENKDDFKTEVINIVKKHDPQHDGIHAVKISKNGTYQSVSVKILATGKEQLQSLHNELKATGRVKIVL